MKTIAITEPIQAALDAVKTAERGYVAGRDPSSRVEIPKIDLADAVLLEVRRRRLPERADRGIVYVKLERTRRKRA